MRILHIAKWDDVGGASIGMLRLHNELLKKGVDSIILCERSRGNVKQVELVNKGWRFQLGRVIERLISYCLKLQKDDSLFFNSVNVRPNELLRRIDELNPDIVHLHWVGLGVLRIEDLPKIKQPIVWTLADMWAFCGSEHYNLHSSERWKGEYSKKSRHSLARGLDISRWVWKRKSKAWGNVPMGFVSPSSWMQESASNSSLWKNNKYVEHYTIPCGLDTSTFKPTPKADARKELGLESNVPVLLFGAFSLSSHIKGGDLLYEALLLASRKGIEFQLATFGGGESMEIPNIETRHMGAISDLKHLASLYSAADIMLVPSKMESFGQVASEALACGTPVLCFDTSGLKDVVEHKVCGYRAECFSIEDFVNGLEWLLAVAPRDSVNGAARKQALSKFQINKVAAAHIDLYSEMLLKR